MLENQYRMKLSPYSTAVQCGRGRVGYCGAVPGRTRHWGGRWSPPETRPAPPALPGAWWPASGSRPAARPAPAGPGRSGGTCAPVASRPARNRAVQAVPKHWPYRLLAESGNVGGPCDVDIFVGEVRSLDAAADAIDDDVTVGHRASDAVLVFQLDGTEEDLEDKSVVQWSCSLHCSGPPGPGRRQASASSSCSAPRDTAGSSAGTRSQGSTARICGLY